MKTTLHLVANSHIDPVWLWDKYEGIDEVINTFRAACDRLDEYPTLKFTMSSLCFLDWTRHFAPDVFARIRTHVAAGRWEIAGGWWIEPDCNLPTAPAFRKSHDIARRFLREYFPGVTVEIGYCPDSFGHPASLPMILAEQGLKYYVFCRPEKQEKPDLPGDLFYWEYEGHRVLCYRLRHLYTQGRTVGVERGEAALADHDFLSRDHACLFFGVGDHGGGPTKAEIEYWLRRQGEVQQCQIRFSTCREFFQAAESLAGIPTYQGDLHYHAVGCYSVNRPLKQAIRSAEQALAHAERLGTMAGLSQDLEPLWRRTIFNQFHDIMPGSCAPEASCQALEEMGGVRGDAEWLAYESLKRLAGRAPVRCPQGEFRIVNTLDHPVHGPFEIESWLYYHEGAPLMDGAGCVIAIQPITPSVICANRRCLLIDTIAARTEKAYYFQPDASAQPTSPDDASSLAPFAAGDSISRGGLAVDASGRILFGDAMAPLSFRLAVIPDASDTWSHGVRGYGEPDGYMATCESSVATGPLASILVLRQRWGNSSVEWVVRIYEGLPYIDLTLTVRWLEERRLLKLILAPEAGIDRLVAQGAGAAWRKTVPDAEEPLHGWLQAGSAGILQDGAFAFDWNDKRLRLTLIRSNLFAFHDPNVVDPRGPLRHTDQGEHRFRLRLMAAGDLAPADMDRRFAEFIEPFRVLRQNA